MSIWTSFSPGRGEPPIDQLQQLFVITVPVRREILSRSLDTPGCQQAGRHADPTGGEIVQRIVANHQAGFSRQLQPTEQFIKKVRVRLAEMLRLVGGHMVETRPVQSSPGETCIDDRARENRVGSQNNLPPPA